MPRKPVFEDARLSGRVGRSEEHTSELRHITISYAVFCLKKKKKNTQKKKKNTKKIKNTTKKKKK